MNTKPNVIILAGGLGTRLSEVTRLKPKPMVEIGGRPIIWHIMKHYARYGAEDFYIALGYKGQALKRFFVDEIQLAGDLVVETGDGRITNHDTPSNEWAVHLCETGMDTNTGGRLRRLKKHLVGSTFLLTYGDGVSDVPIDQLLAFHRSHGKMATVTAVRPPARFGGLIFEGDMIKEFTEKPQIGEGWINGGFMVFEPSIFDHLFSDEDSLETNLLEHLAEIGELAAFRHEGFWQCMDTVREVNLLNAHWDSGKAPWKTWDD